MNYCNLDDHIKTIIVEDLWPGDFVFGSSPGSYCASICQVVAIKNSKNNDEWAWIELRNLSTSHTFVVAAKWLDSIA